MAVLGKLTGRMALAAVIALLVVPASATAAVSIGESSADLDTFQALNQTVEHSANRDGSGFVRFAENLLPPKLKGIEGTAETFAQQGSTIVTPSTSPFPTQPINGIGVSGRARSEATKNQNNAPGVPVADSSGSFSADFSTSGPTPFQFDGALLATNDDADNCTQITVTLTGPVRHTLSDQQGGGCPALAHKTTAFVITNVLPAGDYTLSVDYDAEVDPEDPGTLSALAEVDVNLQFFPPDTKITGAKVNVKHHQATFRFKTIGTTRGAQCALARGHAKLKFARCTSPKTYSHLKSGRYTFAVRALGRAGPDATPAKKRFKIP